MKRIIAWLQARSDRKLRMEIVKSHLQNKALFECKPEEVKRLFDYIKEGKL